MGVYVINGRPESGKSTFCKKVIDLVTENYGIELSTVDLVKNIATMCGWDGTKDDKNRKFLSDLKDLLTEWNDVPVKAVKKSVQTFLYNNFISLGKDEAEGAIFINCREPQEIARLCKELNAKSILVTRDAVANKKPSNHADEGVLNYKYDIVIENNGDLKDLAFTALDFVSKERLFVPYWKNLEIDLFGNIYYN